MYWTRYCQAANTLLLAFNRGSAVLFPLQYERIWSKKWVRVCVFGQIMIGAPVGIFVAFNDYYWQLACSMVNRWGHLDYVRREHSAMQVSNILCYTRLLQYPNQFQALVIIFKNDFKKTLVLAFSFIAECLVFVVLLFNYTFMIITMRRQRVETLKTVRRASTTTRSSKSSHSNYRLKQNFMLLRMAIVICVLELCYAVFGVVSITAILTSDQFHFFYNLMTTVYSSMGPFLMFGFSTTTRRLVYTALFPKKTMFSKTALPNYTHSSKGPTASGRR
ncbi:hypothetical protein L596_021289 [Steinernema carpocapsae]|uniref:Serpentine receptor class gamma n=1 Tax=Steinernema carpocapsae TaxID=34508 RepID=A0A4U5MIC0_STECR|nr:hypothetical protein L596_021289 [Steinernema carpocapsae]